jgi:hypothetical protein
MLGALGKSKEPGMADTPSIQLIAGRGAEALPDAAVPEIGPSRQWPEEADAAPAGCEIRPDKHALIVFRSESGGVLGPEPAIIDIVEVAPELLRVRRREKSRRRPSQYAVLRANRLRSARE